MHCTMCGAQILCMHGGLSPELKSLEQVKRIPRPTDVPDTGLLCDLLWADPDKEVQGWGQNDRGVSYTFGPDSVLDFLAKHDLDLVCRAHQVSPEFQAAKYRMLFYLLLHIMHFKVYSLYFYVKNFMVRARLWRMAMSSSRNGSLSPFSVHPTTAANLIMLEP